MSLPTLMQTIIEIKEIMHAHFKNLLAKLYLIFVYYLSIVPSLSITFSNYSIEFTQQKLKTVWECSQQGLKYTYSNDIYIPPL